MSRALAAMNRLKYPQKFPLVRLRLVLRCLFRANIPEVVVSAYLTPTVARKALEVGFRACFPKPVDTTTYASVGDAPERKGQPLTIL